jgi:hypothetical protein
LNLGKKTARDRGAEIVPGFTLIKISLRFHEERLVHGPS